MLLPQRLLVDGNGSSVQRLRFRIVALVLVESRQVVEAGSQVRMLRPQDLLIDGDGSLVQQCRFGIPSTLLYVVSDLIEQVCSFVELHLPLRDQIGTDQGMGRIALTVLPLLKLNR